MTMKNILKTIVCIFLLLSTVLFALPPITLYFYGLPLIYVCFIVPYIIGKILFADRFSNNAGYGYKFPIILFLAFLMLQTEIFLNIWSDFPLETLLVNKDIALTSLINALWDIDIKFWICIVLLRIVFYASAIYVWLPKTKETNNAEVEIKHNKTLYWYLKETFIIFITLILFSILCYFFAMKLFVIFIGTMNIAITILSIMMMELCLFLILLSMCREVRKKSYIVFAICFGLCVLISFFLPSYSVSDEMDYCLDIAHGVWDSEQGRCRQDCIKWTHEKGCIKSYDEL